MTQTPPSSYSDLAGTISRDITRLGEITRQIGELTAERGKLSANLHTAIALRDRMEKESFDGKPAVKRGRPRGPRQPKPAPATPEPPGPDA